eukprot:6209949-Pleurochrysis_carterae.AAC.3
MAAAALLRTVTCGVGVVAALRPQGSGAYGSSPQGASSRSSVTSRPQQTLSIFYTESDYDPQSRRWVGRVQKLDRDQPEHPHLVLDGVSPTGLALDPRHGRLFVTDPKAPSIMSCELDGSDSRPLVKGLFGKKLNDGPWGVTIAPSLNSVIWTSTGHPAVRRADLDGKNVQILARGDPHAWSATGPFGVAVCLRPGCASAKLNRPMLPHENLSEHGLGRVYWTSWGRIQCCEISTGQVWLTWAPRKLHSYVAGTHSSLACLSTGPILHD